MGAVSANLSVGFRMKTPKFFRVSLCVTMDNACIDCICAGITFITDFRKVSLLRPVSPVHDHGLDTG